MSENNNKETVITDRSTSFGPGRLKTVRRLATVTAVGLVIGGGYFGLKLSPADATNANKVTVPGPNDTADAQRAKPALFSAYPKLDQPEPEGPSALETKLGEVEGYLKALDARLAALAAMPPADTSAAFDAKVAALEASNKAVEELLQKTRSEEEEERTEMRRQRDALRMELSELRAQMLSRPAPFTGTSDADEGVKAEAQHRREMERLRLESELAANERVATRKLEEQLAAVEHTRRMEIAALEKNVLVQKRNPTWRRQRLQR
jgi:hypothetical protein